MLKSVLRVAAAAIVNADGEVLLAKRPPHKHKGDLWEFPGGKIEIDETDAEALVRECQEELGITPTAFRPLLTLIHHYPEKSVQLVVFKVEVYSGELKALEQQPLAWVKPAQMADYPMPEADRPIVTALRLAEQMLITPELKPAQLIEQLPLRLAQGINAVQLRAHHLDDQTYRALAINVASICARFDAQLFLNRAYPVLQDIDCSGWHIRSADLGMNAQSWDNLKRASEGLLLSAACHNQTQLQRAEALGCDFALLSPVQSSASHPQEKALGWPAFAQAVGAVSLPVYALGGLSVDDLACAWQHGGQGIAAIRGLW